MRSLRTAPATAVLALLIACFGATGATGAGPAPALAADVILRGGTVYTADPSQALVQAVALKDGRILALGDAAGIMRHAGPATHVLELDGGMVLPGLHDAHVHPMSAGLWFARCRLNEASSDAALQSTLRGCIAASPAGNWLVARGWRGDRFTEGERARVFERLPWRGPAALLSVRGDRIWLNTAAFERLGFAPMTGASREDGIERDRRGRQTGFVHGAAAGQVRRGLPPPTAQEYRRALRHVTALLNARGVTALTDARVSAAMLAAYHEAEQAGELSVRVTLAQDIEPGTSGEQLTRMVARQPAPGDWMLREDVAKLFVDGDFPDRNAALLEPYADAPDSRGELRREPAELERVVTVLDAAGFDLHLHAIGDRAVRVALDALERAGVANGSRDRRHQIAHLALIDPAELPRFRALGVLANLQLAWAGPEAFTEFDGPQRLGQSRTHRLLPFFELNSHGATLVAGSDGPLPMVDAFEAIEFAATRPTTRHGSDGSASAQALPVIELLRAFTSNGAYAARAERFSGAIIPGHVADLVVIDRNLLAIAPDTISETRVLLTLLSGRAVHVAPDFPWPRGEN